jgi:1-deoxy-D-xylulose-5-phosphate synthase
MDTEFHSISTGKAEILRHGNDVAILALGVTVEPALEAARELSDKGIEATVVNSRFVKPLDSELIKEITCRIKYIVTVEENVLIGGFGSMVVSLLQQSGLSDVQVKSIGIADEFVEHGTQPILRKKYSLDAEGIVRQTLVLLNKAESDPKTEIHTKTRASLI